MKIGTNKCRFWRLLSWATLVFFCVNQVAYANPGAGIEIVGKQELPAYLSIDVPMELGTVDALYEAPNAANPQFILHIQNAHANYQAQMKIKKLLDYMNTKYGFKTIFVEGASEKLDADYLRLFPDQERNLKLCDELAKQGELTGAELYLMEADKNIEALGIEEASLYKANYDALKKVFGAETDVTRFFKGFDTKLDRVASKTFTPEIRELIADWKRFEQGRRQFMPFVQSLAKKSKKILKVDLESLFAQVGWPQITRLLVIQQLEKEMDKAKGVPEQAELVKMLRTKSVSKELIATLESFSEGSIAVGKSTREVSPREVLERLAAEAGPKGFKFSDYPAFSLYAGYVTLRAELDSKVLFEEIEYLFTQMLDTLASEAKQKTLLALYRDGELLRKLLHLELNRAQWRQVVETQDRISVPALVSRLKDVVIASGEKGLKQDKQVMDKEFGGKMDELFTAGLEFYDYAHKREGVFYKEMQTAMTDRKISKAILITGGFHTDGMSDMFRENAISYGIVTPRLSEKSNEKMYENVMMQHYSTLFENSNLEIASLFQSSGTLERQGVIRARLFNVLENFYVPLVTQNPGKMKETLGFLAAVLQNKLGFPATVTQEDNNFSIQIGDRIVSFSQNLNGLWSASFKIGQEKPVSVTMGNIEITAGAIPTLGQKIPVVDLNPLNEKPAAVFIAHNVFATAHPLESISAYFSRAIQAAVPVVPASALTGRSESRVTEVREAVLARSAIRRILPILLASTVAANVLGEDFKMWVSKITSKTTAAGTTSTVEIVAKNTGKTNDIVASARLIFSVDPAAPLSSYTAGPIIWGATRLKPGEQRPGLASITTTNQALNFALQGTATTLLAPAQGVPAPTGLTTPTNAPAATLVRSEIRAKLLSLSAALFMLAGVSGSAQVIATNVLQQLNATTGFLGTYLQAGAIGYSNVTAVTESAPVLLKQAFTNILASASLPVPANGSAVSFSFVSMNGRSGFYRTLLKDLVPSTAKSQELPKSQIASMETGTNSLVQMITTDTESVMALTVNGVLIPLHFQDMTNVRDIRWNAERTQYNFTVTAPDGNDYEMEVVVDPAAKEKIKSVQARRSEIRAKLLSLSAALFMLAGVSGSAQVIATNVLQQLNATTGFLGTYLQAGAIGYSNVTAVTESAPVLLKQAFTNILASASLPVPANGSAVSFSFVSMNGRSGFYRTLLKDLVPSTAKSQELPKSQIASMETGTNSLVQMITTDTESVMALTVNGVLIPLHFQDMTNVRDIRWNAERTQYNFTVTAPDGNDYEMEVVVDPAAKEKIKSVQARRSEIRAKLLSLSAALFMLAGVSGSAQVIATNVLQQLNATTGFLGTYLQAGAIGYSNVTAVTESAPVLLKQAFTNILASASLPVPANGSAVSFSFVSMNGRSGFYRTLLKDLVPSTAKSQELPKSQIASMETGTNSLVQMITTDTESVMALTVNGVLIPLHFQDMTNVRDIRWNAERTQYNFTVTAPDGNDYEMEVVVDPAAKEKIKSVQARRSEIRAKLLSLSAALFMLAGVSGSAQVIATNVLQQLNATTGFLGTYLQAGAIGYSNVTAVTESAPVLLKQAFTNILASASLPVPANGSAVSFSFVSMNGRSGFYRTLLKDLVPSTAKSQELPKSQIASMETGTNSLVQMITTDTESVMALTVNGVLIPLHFQDMTNVRDIRWNAERTQYNFTVTAPDGNDYEMEVVVDPAAKEKIKSVQARRSELREMPAPLSLEERIEAVNEAREATARNTELGIASSVHPSLSSDQTKVEFRSSTKPDSLPVLFLDIENMLAMKVYEGTDPSFQGHVYFVHRKTSVGDEAVDLSPALNLEEYAQRVNQTNVFGDLVVTDFNNLPPEVRNIPQFAALAVRSEVRASGDYRRRSDGTIDFNAPREGRGVNGEHIFNPPYAPGYRDYQGQIIVNGTRPHGPIGADQDQAERDRRRSELRNNPIFDGLIDFHLGGVLSADAEFFARVAARNIADANMAARAVKYPKVITQVLTDQEAWDIASVNLESMDHYSSTEAMLRNDLKKELTALVSPAIDGALKRRIIDASVDKIMGNLVVRTGPNVSGEREIVFKPGMEQRPARSELRADYKAPDPRFLDYYNEAADRIDGVGTQFGRSMLDIPSPGTQAEATASALNRIIEEDGTGELGWEVVNGQLREKDITRSELRIGKEVEDYLNTIMTTNVDAAAEEAHKGWLAGKQKALEDPKNPFVGLGAKRVRVRDVVTSEGQLPPREELSKRVGAEISDVKYAAIQAAVLEKNTGADITHNWFRSYQEVLATEADGGVELASRNAVPLLVLALYLTDFRGKEIQSFADLQRVLAGLISGEDKLGIDQVSRLNHTAFEAVVLGQGERSYANSVKQRVGEAVVKAARTDFKGFDSLTKDVQGLDEYTLLPAVKWMLKRLESVPEGTSPVDFLNNVMGQEVEAAAAEAHNDGWLKGKQAALANPENPFVGLGPKRVRVRDVVTPEGQLPSREDLSKRVGADISEAKYAAIQAAVQAKNTGADITHNWFRPYQEVLANEADGGADLSSRNALPLMVLALYLTDFRGADIKSLGALKQLLENLQNTKDLTGIDQVSRLQHTAFESLVLGQGERGVQSLVKQRAGDAVTKAARTDFKGFDTLTKDVQGLDGYTLLPAAKWMAGAVGARSELRVEEQFEDVALINARQAVARLTAEKEQLAKEVRGGNWVARGKLWLTGWNLFWSQRNYNKLMAERPAGLPSGFTIAPTSEIPRSFLVGAKGTKVNDIGNIRITIGDITDVVPIQVEQINPPEVLLPNNTYLPDEVIIDHPKMPWRFTITKEPDGKNARLEFIARSELRKIEEEEGEGIGVLEFAFVMAAIIGIGLIVGTPVKSSQKMVAQPASVVTNVLEPTNLPSTNFSLPRSEVRVVPIMDLLRVASQRLEAVKQPRIESGMIINDAAGQAAWEATVSYLKDLQGSGLKDLELSAVLARLAQQAKIEPPTMKSLEDGLVASGLLELQRAGALFGMSNTPARSEVRNIPGEEDELTQLLKEYRAGQIEQAQAEQGEDSFSRGYFNNHYGSLRQANIPADQALAETLANMRANHIPYVAHTTGISFPSRSEAREIKVTDAEFAELLGRLKADRAKNLDSVSRIIEGWSYGDVDGYEGVKSLYHTGFDVNLMSRGPNQSYPDDHIAIGFGGLVAKINEEDLKDSDKVLATLKAGIENFNTSRARSEVRNIPGEEDELTQLLKEYRAGQIEQAQAEQGEDSFSRGYFNNHYGSLRQANIPADQALAETLANMRANHIPYVAHTTGISFPSRSEAREIKVTDAEFAELLGRLKADRAKNLDSVSRIIEGWSYGDVDGYEGVKSLYHTGFDVNLMSRGPNQSYPDDHIAIGFGGLVAKINEEDLKDSDKVLATLKAGIENFNTSRARSEVRVAAEQKIVEAVLKNVRNTVIQVRNPEFGQRDSSPTITFADSELTRVLNAELQAAGVTTAVERRALVKLLVARINLVEQPRDRDVREQALDTEVYKIQIVPVAPAQKPEVKRTEQQIVEALLKRLRNTVISVQNPEYGQRDASPTAGFADKELNRVVRAELQAEGVKSAAERNALLKLITARITLKEQPRQGLRDQGLDTEVYQIRVAPAARAEVRAIPSEEDALTLALREVREAAQEEVAAERVRTVTENSPAYEMDADVLQGMQERLGPYQEIGDDGDGHWYIKDRNPFRSELRVSEGAMKLLVDLRQVQAPSERLGAAERARLAQTARETLTSVDIGLTGLSPHDRKVIAREMEYRAEQALGRSELRQTSLPNLVKEMGTENNLKTIDILVPAAQAGWSVAELLELLKTKGVLGKSTTGVDNPTWYTSLEVLNGGGVVPQELLNSVKVEAGQTIRVQYLMPQRRSELRANILVADDEELNRDLYVAILERMGHNVKAAKNGEEAKAILEAGNFDMLLTDWQMGTELNGAKLIEWAQSQAKNKGMKYVFATGGAQGNDTRSPEQVVQELNASSSDGESVILVLKPAVVAPIKAAVARWFPSVARAEVRSEVAQRQIFAEDLGKKLNVKDLDWLMTRHAKIGADSLDAMLGGIILPADAMSLGVDRVADILTAYVKAHSTGEFRLELFLSAMRELINKHSTFAVSQTAAGSVVVIDEIPTEAELASLALQLAMNPKLVIRLAIEESSVTPDAVKTLRAQITAVKEKFDMIGNRLDVDLIDRIFIKDQFNPVALSQINTIAGQVANHPNLANYNKGEYLTVLAEIKGVAEALAEKVSLGTVLDGFGVQPDLKAMSRVVAGKAAKNNVKVGDKIAMELLRKELGDNDVLITKSKGYLEIDGNVLAGLARIWSEMITQAAVSVAA